MTPLFMERDTSIPRPGGIAVALYPPNSPPSSLLPLITNPLQDKSLSLPMIGSIIALPAPPLRRVTTPEEAADATLFFASPWARSVTGQNLIVDGGLVFG